MANGKPPIVWHLDTSRINTVEFNPKDRLTRIRDLMIQFEEEQKRAEKDHCMDLKMPLRKLLNEIEAICQETTDSEELKKSRSL